jgi:hypothetical protein
MFSKSKEKEQTTIDTYNKYVYIEIPIRDFEESIYTPFYFVGLDVEIYKVIDDNSFVEPNIPENVLSKGSEILDSNKIKIGTVFDKDEVLRGREPIGGGDGDSASTSPSPLGIQTGGADIHEEMTVPYKYFDYMMQIVQEKVKHYMTRQPAAAAPAAAPEEKPKSIFASFMPGAAAPAPAPEEKPKSIFASFMPGAVPAPTAAPVPAPAPTPEPIPEPEKECKCAQEEKSVLDSITNIQPTVITKQEPSVAPETPAPETPAPETPAPETPAPETPAPETPAPETPAPEIVPPPPAPQSTPGPHTKYVLYVFIRQKIPESIKTIETSPIENIYEAENFIKTFIIQTKIQKTYLEETRRVESPQKVLKVNKSFVYLEPAPPAEEAEFILKSVSSLSLAEKYPNTKISYFLKRAKETKQIFWI